jgi:uncharacterized protein with HEPN domain
VNDEERIDRWLSDLESTLREATLLAARGVDAYRQDAALPLAFEALVNRVGDLAKRLVRADAARFANPTWSSAARTRYFVAHHYDRIDAELLWRTVTISFPRLLELVEAAQRP